jgi:sugar/nucleoside kinase (ribokinase family)
MTQSQQQSERKFIAVQFRGVQQMSRERTALTIVGPAGLDVLAAPDAPLPEPEELEEGGGARPPQPVRGETSILLGGEGARAACAYAALGGVARFAGTVGDDLPGEVALRWLADRGVDTTAVRRRQRAGVTSAGILLAPPGHRPLLVHRGEREAEAPEVSAM